MKVALICLAICLGAAVAFDEGYMFQQYMNKYEKTYSTPDELQYRFQVWKTNLALVNKHNADAAAGKHSFTLEMNHLADLTNAEYKRSMLGVNPGLPQDAELATFTSNAVPAAWDWRTHKPSVVNPVKNQGQCGSCWSFSAVATVEGAYALKTGTLKSLSEQQLVDCVNGGINTCSVGGEMYQGVEYIAKNGVETESDYPYTATSGGGCKFDKSKVAATVTGYKNITSGDEAALKTATYNQPIISVGIDASSIFFQLYSSGVYDDTTFCKSDINDLDHGVAVVGYGTDASSGKDYWIVRNSWGAVWGQQGYIWMVRNKNNQCGIATQACFATV